MLASKITIKGQATIPSEVRKKLHLAPGDRIQFEIRGHEAIITKMHPLDYHYHRALSESLNEWSSPEDEEAYHDL